MALHQCPLRLWNETYRRDEAVAPSHATQARFDTGTEVGELGRRLYPGGKLIDAEYYDAGLALRQTANALSDGNVSSMFEPAFEYRRTRVRCDLLHRGSNDWELWEVKSVLNPQEYHVLDVAIQAHITMKAMETHGIPFYLKHAGIAHLNRDYIFDGVRYDPEQLFVKTDFLEQVLDLEQTVDEMITQGLEIADSPEPPIVAPGDHCQSPYDCPFLGSTCPIPVQHELTTVPGIGPAKLEKLIEQGITTLDELAASSIQLNGAQSRMLQSRATGQSVVEPTLATELADISYPRFHLDFETFAPGLPRYKGTHPFQAIAFQYSIHLEYSEGQDAEHFGYLHCEDTDPRQALVEHMLGVLELFPEAPVLMYTSYEKRVLNELADALPSYAARLNAVIERLVDLCAIVKNNVYHPDFGGSFSIKDVLPALVPDLNYDGLEIADGTTASRRYLDMIELAKSDEAAAHEIWEQLWEYCKRDTEAMVAVTRALWAMTHPR